MIRLEAQSSDWGREIFDNRMPLDFPANEIKPWEVAFSLYRKGRYAFLAAFSGEEYVGYAWCYVPETGAVLLDYFAVLPQFRDKGIGSGILEALKRRYGTILLESEFPETAPDPDTAQRRLGFYLRNGMAQTGLLVRLFGVDFCILSNNPVDAKAEMTAIYRGMLGDGLFDKAVRMV